ncbi:hypothetical protein KIL84_009473 [Mauremys mutica]|uniref:Endoplasmic reticulum transmembrane protein n=1 Tax=Mauremys mutica TaxID=74926 RepID=A0A9D4BBF9_9SAUR|nr:hypothetical protein KIL84_009473 [Mauremys mutica]
MSLQWSAVATFLYAEVCAVLLLCVPFISAPSLLRRLVTLISQQATLLASNAAFKKQAEGASDAAKRYMEDNDQLKQELKQAGVEVGERPAEGPGAAEQNEALKAELKQLKEELATSKRAAEKAEREALAMRKQAQGLTQEYDRLLEEHGNLQMLQAGPKDKKEE